MNMKLRKFTLELKREDPKEQLESVILKFNYQLRYKIQLNGCSIG